MVREGGSGFFYFFTDERKRHDLQILHERAVRAHETNTRMEAPATTHGHTAKSYGHAGEILVGEGISIESAGDKARCVNVGKADLLFVLLNPTVKPFHRLLERAVINGIEE